MKVLLCHTRYLQRGGEDCSFEEERDLLRAGGHDVLEYLRTNEDMQAMGSLRAATTTVWNRRAARDVAALVQRERPAVVHVTNSFPLLSPAVCRVARRHGAAVVQALRNYRLLCAGSYLMRDGRPCEDCVGRAVPWPAVRHGCYRDSKAATAAVAAMQVTHRLLGTWRRHVDAFFTLTEFARSRFLAAGFPAERVHVKYNCVSPDPGPGQGGAGVVFVGRLSPEKGIRTMLAAWRQFASLPALTVIGAGPLAGEVASAAAEDPRIEWLGELPSAEVHRRIGAARALLIASEWYETFGRTIAEAFAAGTPVVASALGAMQELVADRSIGWQFAPGDAVDLARAVAQAADCPPAEYAAMRLAARREYEAKYTPQRNYRRLIEIYDVASQRRAAQFADEKSSAGVAIPRSPVPTACGSVSKPHLARSPQ